MGKKKKKGETISISLEDISKHVVKEYNLPSGPTQGMQNKSSKGSAKGMDSKTFYRNYGTSTGPKREESRYPQRSHSSRIDRPKEEKRPPADFNSLFQNINQPRGQQKGHRARPSKTWSELQHSSNSPRKFPNFERSSTAQFDKRTAKRIDFSAMKSTVNQSNKKEITIPLRNIERPFAPPSLGRKPRISAKSTNFPHKIVAPVDNTAKKADPNLQKRAEIAKLQSETFKPISSEKNSFQFDKKADKCAFSQTKSSDSTGEKDSHFEKPRKGVLKIPKELQQKVQSEVKKTSDPQKTTDPPKKKKKTLLELLKNSQENRDVLTKLSNREKEKKRKEEKRVKELQEKHALETEKASLKRLTNLLQSKRNEGVEFYGHFKKSDDRVDSALWKLGYTKLYQIHPDKYSENFAKLTAWGLQQNVLDFQTLSNALFGPPEEQKTSKTDSDAAKIRNVSFTASVLSHLADNFGERFIEAKLKKEGVTPEKLFRENSNKIQTILSSEKLDFLLPKKSMAEEVRRLLQKETPATKVVDLLEKEGEKLREEPCIAALLTRSIFEDYFSLGEEVLRAAVSVERLESDGGEEYSSDSEKEEDFEPKVRTSVSEKVASFFSPHRRIFELLKEASLGHQRALLNQLASAWEEKDASKVVVEMALRAICEMGFVEYEGFSEWRHWIPEEGEEKFTSARRKALIAATAFLDGDLEDEHQRHLRREEAEWEQSDSSAED